MELPSSSSSSDSTYQNMQQKRMGPAPFASFEDLSDEMDSPSEKEITVIRLPGISEQEPSSSSSICSLLISPSTDTRRGISLIGAANHNNPSSSMLKTASATSSQTPSPIPTKMKLVNTPRIDISRASSSSHHDSKDSTPEREIFENNDPNTVKLGLGFKEDDTLELRLSTEELDFHDVNSETKSHKYKHRSASPEFDELYLNNNNNNNNRKDSQCSDVILLSISGRTSRISSIGSQGSAQSRLSNASHISLISGHSAYSHCSSPHKTLLETSFCGSQANIAGENIENTENSDFEKVLLARKSDPAKVLLAENLGHKIIRRRSEAPSGSSSAVKQKNDEIINKEAKNVEKSKMPRKIIAKSGVEYIYIPLKGPLPVDEDADDDNVTREEKILKNKARKSNRKESATTTTSSSKSKKSHNTTNKSTSGQKSLNPPSTAATTTHHHHHKNLLEPKYIRIKLKPDHCYDDFDGTHQQSSKTENTTNKPSNLSLSLPQKNYDLIQPADSINHQDINYINNSTKEHDHHARSLTNSPKLIRKESGGPSSSSCHQTVPRRNSFVTLFRTSDDSPTITSRLGKRKNSSITSCGGVLNSNTTTSGKTSTQLRSSTESVDSKGKYKSVLSLFKFPREKHKASTEIPLRKVKSAEPKTRTHHHHHHHYKEEKRENNSSESVIRIPLHSPTYYENKDLLFQDLQSSSQDSQITVVEINNLSKPNVVVVETEDDDDKIETISVIETVPSINEEVQTKDKPTETSKLPENLCYNNNNNITTTEVELTNVSVELSCPSLCDDISVKTSSEPQQDVHSVDEHYYSSESERDVEFEDPSKINKPLLPNSTAAAAAAEEIECKSIVLQQDSFEDELPYVPTTLPQERSAAVPILPVKQRCVMEMKTCPIERPRSTTPIHSSGLENYFEGFPRPTSSSTPTEKLKISLPKQDSSSTLIKCVVAKTSNLEEMKKSLMGGETTSPPPLPPKGIQRSWINFEEVPERRKPPKRIQTIPSRGHIDVSGLAGKENVVYTYVNPEECKCECHDHNDTLLLSEKKMVVVPQIIQDDELPLLNQEDNNKDDGLANNSSR